MQERENPHTPGAGRKPPTSRPVTATWRVPGANRAARRRRRRASLIFSPLRGVGKTVLLMELDVLATEAGWATTDDQQVGSQPISRHVRTDRGTAAARDERKHRIKDHVDRALGRG